MAEIVIKLIHPKVEGDLTQVILRTPTLKDRRQLGDIYPEMLKNNDVYIGLNDEIISRYIDRLLVYPKIPSLIDGLELADAIQIIDTVTGFFTQARKDISKASQIS